MPPLGPGQKYALLIQGGEVLDPSQDLRGRRDVVVHDARIAGRRAPAAGRAGDPGASATGKLVLPGLVDLHAHVFPQASGLGLPADEQIVRAAGFNQVGVEKRLAPAGPAGFCVLAVK